MKKSLLLIKKKIIDYPGNLLPLFSLTCLLLFGLLTQAACIEKGSSVFDVREFGAAGDGKTLDTPAINKAIQACNQSGGGTVLFTHGEYVTGTFVLLSNVTLKLEAGAVIKASTNLADYKLKSEFKIENRSGISGEGARLGLIVATEAENIAIIGQGAIDGRGTYFMTTDSIHNPKDWDPALVREGKKFLSTKSIPWDGPLEPSMAWDDRPGILIFLSDCKNVLIRDVTLRDSHNWTLHITKSEDVVISGINILNNPMIPNNDGINISVKNARISDCYVNAGDDAIAANNCENLTVVNCTLISRSSAIRLYQSTYCTFSNMVIRDSNRGIGIYGSDNHILFSDILIQTRLFNGAWWGKSEPIFITSGGESASVSDIRFSNIIAEGEAGILVYGDGPGSIENLSFDRIKLLLKGGPASAFVGGNFDLRSDENIFKHDIPAFYCQNVDGLQIHGFEVDWADNLPEYFTEAIYCEHFSNLIIDGFIGRQAHASVEAAVVLKDGSKVSITNSKAANGTSSFLSMDRVKDQRLFINNDLSNAKEAFSPAQFKFSVISGNDLGEGLHQTGKTK